MSLKCKIFGVKKIFVSGLVYYDQDKHCSWKKIMLLFKIFARNTVGFISITETYEESICKKIAFI